MSDAPPAPPTGVSYLSSIVALSAAGGRFGSKMLIASLFAFALLLVDSGVGYAVSRPPGGRSGLPVATTPCG